MHWWEEQALEVSRDVTSPAETSVNSGKAVIPALGVGMLKDWAPCVSDRALLQADPHKGWHKVCAIFSYGGCAETPVESKHSWQSQVTLSGRGHWITLHCLPVLLCVSFRFLMLNCRGVAQQGLSCADTSPSWLYLYKGDLNQYSQEWSQICLVLIYQSPDRICTSAWFFS